MDHEQLADILSDDEFFAEFSTQQAQIFDTSRYQKTIHNQSKMVTISARKRMTQGFSHYDAMFKKVRQEIATGERRIQKFSMNGAKTGRKIMQGSFYIDNGVMLYVNKIYDPKTLKEESSSTNRKLKVHTIYENGTENHIWLLSLVSSLYDTKRNGRSITETTYRMQQEVEDGIGVNNRCVDVVSEESVAYHTTGFIYVVKYAGEDENLKKMNNLVKIGFAKDVQHRLSNTQNQLTYLYAPVQLVSTYEIQNVDAKKIETTLHHVFAHNRVDLSIIGPNGKIEHAKEWFIASPEEIQDAINTIITEIQQIPS